MTSEVEAITQSVIPYFPNDHKKSRYLTFRVAGFTKRESCHLSGCTDRSVLNWRRTDEQFRRLDDEGLTDLRKKLSDEYAHLEFTRNFHLVMEKDFQVLNKSVRGIELTKQEHEYLLKLRSVYTPQHLMMIKQLLGEVAKDADFDFTKLTFTIQREREQLTITGETRDPGADGNISIERN